MSEDCLRKMRNGQLTVYHQDRTKSRSLSKNILNTKPASLGHPPNLTGFVHESIKCGPDELRGDQVDASEGPQEFYLCLSAGKGAIVVKDLLRLLYHRGHAGAILPCERFCLEAADGRQSVSVVGQAIVEFFLMGTITANEPTMTLCKYPVLITDSYLAAPVRSLGKKSHRVSMWIGTDDKAFSVNIIDPKLWVCRNDEGEYVELDRCGTSQEQDVAFAQAYDFYNRPSEEQAGDAFEDSDGASEGYDGSDTAPLLDKRRYLINLDVQKNPLEVERLTIERDHT